LPNSSFNLHPKLGPVNWFQKMNKNTKMEQQKKQQNERLPNNAVPPGFRCAQPGEQAALERPSGRKNKMTQDGTKATCQA
jgi:hypothetical protein